MILSSLSAARMRALLACVLSAVLAGCASGVQPLARDFEWPLAYDAAEANALPPAVLDAWWKSYQDPQLQSLVERSLEGGLDARLALARLDEAHAVRGQALSRFAPQGALQANAERTQSSNLGTGPSPPRSETRNVSLPTSWELDLFGRRIAARTTADADLAAARFEYEAARAALAAQVAQTLFEARGLAARLQDARANERIQASLLELLERRVERGLSASSEADRVAAEVARSSAMRLGLEAELIAARRALLVLTGDGLASIDSMVVTDTLGSPPGVPAALPSDLLARRPDVRQAHARIVGAGGAVRLAELDFFPSLVLQPSLGATRQTGPVESRLSFWSIGASLMLPVLDRPRLLAALDVQSARGQQAVAGYEKAVQNAFAEADQAFVRLGAARERTETLQQGEMRAQRAFAAAQVRYQRGLGDLQGLLDGEAAWRATRTALTSARLDRLLGSVQAFKALGGGWTVPLPPSRP